MSDCILNIENLNKKYRDNVALKNVNLSIKKGDICGFIGENGAGKTTLIRMITGLGQPDDGKIELFDETGKKNLLKQRKKIGCIIESPAMYSNMTARQNLEIIRVQRRIKEKQCIEEVLKIVKLDKTNNKKAKNFSLGMKQRLALAIALLGNPEFLLLDEPVNGLDPSGIIEFRELIKFLNKEKGITILISSHLLSELHLLATNYVFIHSGEIIEQISSEELNKRCKKHIALNVDDNDKTKDILQKELNINDFEIDSNGTFKIYTDSNKAKEISSFLFKNNIGIEQINIKSDDLENYYTKLMEEASNV